MQPVNYKLLHQLLYILLLAHKPLSKLPPVRLKELLGPKAENELVGWKFGLLAVSMGLHNPELWDREKYTQMIKLFLDVISGLK